MAPAAALVNVRLFMRLLNLLFSYYFLSDVICIKSVVELFCESLFVEQFWLTVGDCRAASTGPRIGFELLRAYTVPVSALPRATHRLVLQRMQ